MFEAEAPGDNRPREAIARTRAFARGESAIAEEIRHRSMNGDAAREVRAAAAERHLPPAGENASGPLGPGLLASSVLGSVIRDLRAGLAHPEEEDTWR